MMDSDSVDSCSEKLVMWKEVWHPNSVLRRERAWYGREE